MDRSTANEMEKLDFSRREFFKVSALTIGAAGAWSMFASPQASATAKTKGLPLSLAGYKYDRVEALVNGQVEIEGCDMQFEKGAIGDMNTNIFSGPQTYDVTEIGLHPFMLAYANDGFRDYSLLPIFPFRVFRHKSIFIRTDRGIKKPEDLRGKKIATPGFSSTSLTWLRGIMQHEYGVKQEDIKWVVSAEDSSAKTSGQVSKFENVTPKGLSVMQGPAGKDESDLLESGEVDALFHAIEPRAYVQGNPKVARLFSDYRKTEQEYFKKTGIFPIMHAVAIRNSLVKTNPWLPKAVFNAYSKAKQQMYDQLRKMGWAMISLPWVGMEIADTRELMGENYWPYGIDPNRKALEALFQYSFEQKLCSRKLTIEELFLPESLKFIES